jgi:hypothetical protein
MSDHNNVVAGISAAYEKKGFRVQSRGNNLPQGSNRNEAIYRPDLVVRNPASHQIVHIVEVETGDAGKAVVGAAVLADICMGIEIEKGRQQKKPTLIFVFYEQSANLQLGKKRLTQLARQNRIRHLADVLIRSEKEALEENLRGFTT